MRPPLANSPPVTKGSFIRLRTLCVAVRCAPVLRYLRLDVLYYRIFMGEIYGRFVNDNGAASAYAPNL